MKGRSGNPDPLPLRPERGASRPDGVERVQRGDEALHRLDAAIHELAGLLDGSLRLLDMARRRLSAAGDAPTDARAEDALRHLDGVHAAMAHIANLVRGAGGAQAVRRFFAGANDQSGFGAAVQSAADLLRPEALSRNIMMRVDIDEALVGARCGPIYAVVSNAVRNSIEAIGRSGAIDIRARLGPRGHAVVEIIDDGPGPPGDASRVFEPGFSTKPGSAGIGLALARELVEEAGGTIELSRPESGRGAVLRAIIPVRAGMPGHRPGSAATC